ncbi:MAG: hypothetical protein VX000_08630, partial [Myxococcota bacterium]|nr:hypothetical protein [Myxococcota bacterium]
MQEESVAELIREPVIVAVGRGPLVMRVRRPHRVRMAVRQGAPESREDAFDAIGCSAAGLDRCGQDNAPLVLEGAPVGQLGGP